MLRGLLFVRMKAAERALRDGRFDQAYRMAVEPDICGHPRGARLLAGLAKAFVQRAREHYRAERFTEALLDLGKADRCGGMEAQVAELREQITTVAQEVARQEADRRRRLEEARRCMQGGSIIAGKRLLETADADDTELQGLRKEIARREKRCEDLLTQAEGLFKQNQVESAIDRVVRARKLNAHNDRALRLETQICDQAIKQVRQAFEAGRLSHARASLAALQALGQQRSERAELSEMLELAGQAGRAIAAGRFDEAQRCVHRLQGLSPKTAWIKQAGEKLGHLDAALLALRGGPLGESVPKASPVAGGTATALQETVALARQAPAPAAPLAASSLPRQLLLLVDGGGSYLVHRGERVSMGRAASDDPADVPIFSDLSERHADLARVEDDYFLLSPHEVEVAGKRTRHQLLRDGDRVVMARRAKFTFRVPNRKSPSAKMDISDSTKMPNDVRRVVLFKDTAMIGRGANCHINCHTTQRDLVLFERGGRMWVRPQGRGAGAEAKPVELGQTVEMEGASFVVQPWAVRTPGSSRPA